MADYYTERSDVFESNVRQFMLLGNDIIRATCGVYEVKYHRQGKTIYLLINYSAILIKNELNNVLLCAKHLEIIQI